MSALSFARIMDITLPVNGSAGDSNVIPMKGLIDDADVLTVAAPASLDANTYTWLGSIDNGTTYTTICGTDGTTALPVPAAGKSMSYSALLFGMYAKIKLHSSGAIATTAKVFQFSKGARGL